MSDPSEPAAHPRTDQARPPRSVAIVFWLLVGAVGWNGLGPIWLAALRPADGRVNDFYQDWGSARNYVVGMPVYSPHSRSIPRHLGLSANPNPTIEYNAHPPSSVLLALPLARLAYPDAVLIWNSATLIAFAAALGLLARELALGWRAGLVCVALLAYCHPVYGNVYQGQLTLLLVLLVVVVWILDRRGRENLAGAVVGAAAAIKLFPAYLLVVFAARSRLRPIAWAGAVLAIVSLATAWILGFEAYRDYVRVVLPDQARFRSYGFNIALAGFWYKLFDPASETGLVASLYPSPALARVGTLASDLAVTLLVVAASARARTRPERDLAFSLAVVGMLLVSPVTWGFSLPLLLVPAAVLARESTRGPVALGVLIAAAVVAWIPQSLFMSLVGEPTGPASPAFMLGAPALKFYVLMAMLGLLARACFSRRESPARIALNEDSADQTPGPVPQPRVRSRPVAVGRPDGAP